MSGSGRVNFSSRYLTLACLAAFLVLLAALHVLEPEFNPPHLISEYELGRFGFLMSLAFFFLGMGSLFLAHALWPTLRTRAERVGGWWLVCIGVAYIGGGVFTPDPTSTVESLLHGICGLIVIFSSPIVFTLLTYNVSHRQQGARSDQLLLWATIAAWLGLVLFYGSTIVFYGLLHGMNAIIVGWTNRFMIVTYCAWLIARAWRRDSSHEVPNR